MYQLPVAALRNDHTLGDLNNTNVFSYNSGGQESEISLTGPEPRCGQVASLPKALGEPASFLVAVSIPWLVVPSP